MIRLACTAIAVLLTAPATAQQYTPRDESPEQFVAGAGRDETFYACTACHNFKLVAAQGLSRAGGGMSSASTALGRQPERLVKSASRSSI